MFSHKKNGDVEISVGTAGFEFLDKFDSKATGMMILGFNSSMVPVSSLIGRMGYQGVAGASWGIVIGAIVVVASDLGFKLVKAGRQLMLSKNGVIR